MGFFLHKFYLNKTNNLADSNHDDSAYHINVHGSLVYVLQYHLQQMTLLWPLFQQKKVIPQKHGS